MTLIEARSVTLPSSGLVKMEERKRPLPPEPEEYAPPHKRQATSVNGGSKGHADADVPGKDELERFQKEAIWRQMQEYKRERNTLESRLNELTKTSAYHDDHLRVIDAWFRQLLDEVKLLVGKPENVVSISSFPSSLLFSNTATFEQHLKSRSEEISSTISHLFAQSSVSSPETSELQAKIIQLLAAEKTHLTELDKSRLEKEQLEERLESASMRYMVAEKKLDRAKSMTVAKLERQATAGGRSEAGSGLGGGLDSSGISKGDMTNGLVENGDINSDAEEARKSAVAASAKQKEQIEKLEAENDKLSGQFTALNNKMSHLSDDDYARTDLFKQLKSQHEEVIKRINDLEATNVKLREEAEKLQSERTAYRVQLENETQTAIAEKDALLARAESDLARIRTGRDELTADLQVRKATQDQDRASVRQTKELSLTREERIKALESEIERLRVHAGQTDCLAVSSSDLEQLPIEELRTKYANLDRQYSMLGQELSSMGTAYKRASTLASQKILDASTLEEKVMRLGAEKSKADQKYFSAMKAKEAREQEVRTLRAQNSKSSEIVSSLKEAEAASRALVAKIEAQSGEVKDALNTMTNRNRTTQQQLVEKNFVIEGLKNQVEELKKNAIAKDASSSTAATSFRRAEVEIEELKSKLADTKKSLETWRSRGHGDQSGGSAGYEALRVLAICTVCRTNFKNTCIKTCGHVFCKSCVEERLTSRSRKCPNCNRAFGLNDSMHVTL